MLQMRCGCHDPKGGGSAIDSTSFALGGYARGPPRRQQVQRQDRDRGDACGSVLVQKLLGSAALRLAHADRVDLTSPRTSSRWSVTGSSEGAMTTEHRPSGARVRVLLLCACLACRAWCAAAPGRAARRRRPRPAESRPSCAPTTSRSRENCSKCHDLDRPLRAHVDDVAPLGSLRGQDDAHRGQRDQRARVAEDPALPVLVHASARRRAARRGAVSPKLAPRRRPLPPRPRRPQPRPRPSSRSSPVQKATRMQSTRTAQVNQGEGAP